ncbi:MAG TPA: M55 family metallopeptidase [Vicinamibacteria bacterium]|nr:M55 family metallopeptidase [Vicinamibacteria bacterium]
MKNRIPFLLLLGFGGCQTAAPPVEETSPVEKEAFVLEEPPPDTDGVLRVLVLHDMEGLSGQNDPRTFEYDHKEQYAFGREQLVGDVNSVIAGLFGGGVDEVHVVDGHGSGNPEPDLLLDRLYSRAQMVFRDEPFRQYVDLVEPKVYDAVAVVGMHAKTGSRGFASHTYTLGIEMRLNGRAITETELVGFSFGRAGIPVIFASGDDRLGADLETMPWIEFVTTKTATSASTADLLPQDQVRAELEAAAQRAIEKRGDAKVMKIEGPVEASLHAVPPASLQVLEGVPGIEYENETVTFVAKDFQAAYDGLIELIGVATTNYNRLLVETLRATPEGSSVLTEYSDKLVARWLDFESGRWTPPAPEPPPAGQRYHGAR